MNKINLETARAIIDFSGGKKELKSLGDEQLKGAVALHNMIANKDQQFAYLADEVGMGKTYVALGVVTLMRFFNPTLKVLYICPSKNVQEKWVNEYYNFLKYNVKKVGSQLKNHLKSSLETHISCDKVHDFLKITSYGYFQDYFVRKSIFSISLNDNAENWKERIDYLKKIIPARKWKETIKDKDDLKDQYAKAFNYIMPTFDLVIVDEAHNFKHNFESSSRNRVLSKILGFNGDEYDVRVKNALFISATPYDRNLDQLRNQLAFIGKKELIEKDIDSDESLVKENLKKIMVRRLNTLHINQQPHTRNMYRNEYRKGEHAEIEFVSDEQKLITALVQKKVGEMMEDKSDKPSYQIGMLSSFESYSQTAKAEIVQFDSDNPEERPSDAQDKNVITHLVASYKNKGLGNTLPHPKMDMVCESIQNELFNKGSKRIVFVRRVKSVSEVKEKLEDHYNIWLEQYISNSCHDYPNVKDLFKDLFERYKNSRKNKVVVEDGDNYINSNEDIKSTPDTFYSWFFRGKFQTSISDNSLKTPFDFRQALSKKDFFEINWVKIICHNAGLNTVEFIRENIDDIFNNTTSNSYPNTTQFIISQILFLKWYSKYSNNDYSFLIEKLSEKQQSLTTKMISKDDVLKSITEDTFYSLMSLDSVKPILEHLQLDFLNANRLNDSRNLKEKYNRLDTAIKLINQTLRTGHGGIDLYISYQKNKSTLNSHWLGLLIREIESYRGKESFNTITELRNIIDNLDLIIKVSLPEVLDFEEDLERKKYISRQLFPVSPIIGASGTTINSRSAQARKFRMPGYPLALISTNVFQEGEDLHTFCDSVIHYGISNSPISIEQKTGRVDRINSLAHRALSKTTKSTIEKDGIKVYFPYIKESIEFLQMRDLGRNMNDFLLSLHDIHNKQVVNNTTIDVDRELKDNSDIPDPIIKLLESPYNILSDNKLLFTESNKIASYIDESKNRTNKIEKYIQSLIGKDSSININATQLGHELLLSKKEKFKDHYIKSETLIEEIDKYSWYTPYRIVAEKSNMGTYTLYKACEMFVGDEGITQKAEIDEFRNRFNVEFSSSAYSIPTSKKILNCLVNISSIKKSDSIYGTRIIKKGENSIQFFFGKEFLNRNHVVEIREIDEYCIFLAKAVDSKIVKELEPDEIIEHTWIRNKFVNVVEFTLNPDGYIYGRSVHLIANLNWEEFIYSAYILAMEADRLEYLFNEKDEF